MMRNGPSNVVVDLRVLQDPGYARRGVGRHALGLLRHAPSGPHGVRLVGLVDPNLPPLIEEAQDFVAETHPNAYAVLRSLGEQAPYAPYVALSPMTHDPLFGGRFLTDGRRLRATVVYDFIPRRWPERYLPGPTQRLAYATQIRWLAHCDIFAPISESAGDDLIEILRVHRRAVAVTGAPLDPAFDDARSFAREKRRHFLVVGGGDPRKNPEVVVAAHAASRVLQDLGIPLVIGGQYPADAEDKFRAIAEKEGGRPDLVDVPGGVTEGQLLALYAEAIAVICPSYDEGFSLPVVEGMAAGVPVFASDIPAHRELVTDTDLRFSPDDADAIVPLLERAVNDPVWCEETVDRQAAVWPRFRSEEVGRRFWEHLETSLKSPSPAVLRRAKPRVALLSPLSPDRSGVADYSTATCAALGELVDLHVFTETEHPIPIEGVSIRPFSALPALSAGFDRVVHVIGNSHFHLRTFELLLRYGGAAIAHDARMLGFYRILLGLDRALQTASTELGRPVDEAELNLWLSDEGRLEALFLDEVMDASSPMIVHSRITADRLATRRGRSPVYIPFSIYRALSRSDLTPEARAAARTRLGIPPDEVAIVTLGAVNASKAPEECIWALDVLRGWRIPARLYFVGEMTSPHMDAHLRDLTRRLNLEDHIVFLGEFVSEAAYRDALVGADAAIQLRTYALGGLSGALLDCIAAGLPTVGNRSLTDAVETPDQYVASIPDALSPVLLAKAVADLLEAQREEGADRRRELVRAAFCQDRSMTSYAAALCRALDIEPSQAVLRSVA